MIGKQILELRNCCCRITASAIGKSPDIHVCRDTECIILICGCGLCRCSRLDNAVYCHQPPGFVILPCCAGSLHSININLSTTVITCRKSQDNIAISHFRLYHRRIWNSFYRLHCLHRSNTIGCSSDSIQRIVSAKMSKPLISVPIVDASFCQLSSFRYAACSVFSFPDVQKTYGILSFTTSLTTSLL